MLIIVEKISSIFLIVAVGFALHRLKVIPYSANQSLINLLFNITMPALILTSVTSHTLTEGAINEALIDIGMGIFFYIVSIPVAYIIVRFLVRPKQEEIGPYSYQFASINNGFIGFPIALALFGSQMLYLMILQNTVMPIYMFSLGLLIIELGKRGQKMSLKAMLMSFVKPATICAVVGLIMLFLGIKLPGLVNDCLGLIGDMTTPLSMIVVGMQLGECHFKEIIKNGKKLLLQCFLKVTILPIAVFLAVAWLPIPTDIKICTIFSATLPMAVATAPVLETRGYDPGQYAQAIALTSLFSIVTIPIGAAFLMDFFNYVPV